MLLAQSLTDRLEGQGFHVDEADRGEDALELSDIYEYQVMILDLGLPDMSGDEVLDNLRAKNERLPVLVLSGEADVEARLSCLRAGADDYLTKPFNMDELVARLHALVRRANGHANNRLQFGDITLDLTARDVQGRRQSCRFDVERISNARTFVLAQGQRCLKRELSRPSLWRHG